MNIVICMYKKRENIEGYTASGPGPLQKLVQPYNIEELEFTYIECLLYKLFNKS
jgi:hypothetical protein